MLCGFMPADEDDRDIPSVAVFQDRILIDIHFAKRGVEFSQKHGDGSFGFFAQVTSGAGVEGDVARPARRQPQIFRALAHGLGVEYFMNGPECG